MSHASRLASRTVQSSKTQMLPDAKFIRKAHVVTDVDGAVQFTGEHKVKDQTLPSISAAKRWVRARRFKQHDLRVVA